ncbi:hypothetical protein [Lacrimispora brassicae]
MAQAHCLEIAPHGDQTINVSLGSAVSNVSYIKYYPLNMTVCGRKLFAIR